MVAHNNPIQSAHLRKKWQFHVRTWFNQPARKAARHATRVAKAKKVHPKPAAPLRPVVRCQTVKYNTKARVGRGFTPAEVKAAGLNLSYARTYGIALDYRRKNRSEEGFQVNVERLKQYKSKLVVFAAKTKVAKKFVTAGADVKDARQVQVAKVFPVVNKPVQEAPRAITAEEQAQAGKVVNMLRQALTTKKLYGRRVNKYNKQLSNKAAADKKAAKNANAE